MQLDPLPAAYYYYYFWLFEPLVLSITSALISSLDPQSSAADLLPKGLEVSTQDLGSTTRGKTVIRTLSSFMFLEGAQALLLYPIIKNKLVHLPQVQEKLVAALQGPLILADLSLLLITFLHLPVEVRYDPTAWTFVITSTAVICPILVAVRYVAQFLMSMWRAGHFGPDAQVGLVRWLRTLSTLLSVQDRLKRVLQTPWTTDT